MMGSEVREFEIASTDDELYGSNRKIWRMLGIKKGDSAIFFPVPNALIPVMFAKFMNKRKVTFVDTNEINVSTLLKLSAQMKLSNVTVKLASSLGRFPVLDSIFDLAFSDWGLSHFAGTSQRVGDPEALAKELVRVTKPGGKIACIEENGAPVMFPCPPEIMSIRSKIESPRADRLIMGRKVYGFFKANNLKKIELHGFSDFLTGERQDHMRAEINRVLSNLENNRNSITGSGVSSQEIDKYGSWLKSQLGNESFLIQLNSILTIGTK